MGGSGWDIILGVWGGVRVGGTLFWVAGDEWNLVRHYLGEWGCMEMSGGRCTV